jgi:GTPase SAR1 family protein
MIEEEFAKQIYNLAKEQGWIEKLLSILSKKYNVLVLGASGVGKTNLIESLIIQTPEVIHHSDRTLAATESSIQIKKLPFKFIDTPGEFCHKPIRKEAIKNVFTDISILINVVCYGYHESGEENRVFLPNGEAVHPDYLEENRKKEIEAMQEWTEILGGHASYRLLTIVSKADLWWDRRDEVTNYYNKGEYHNKLGACLSLNPVVTHPPVSG